MATYPGPVGIHNSEEITRHVEATVVDGIIAGLTRRDTAAQAPTPKSTGDEIVFRGTADEINQHFAVQDWSDGLPIVPPTRDRVEAFLAFSPHAPDATIALLPSANLRATPWNIAANAVMAGCEPRHMPLLLAAAQALGDEKCALGSLGSTSGIFPYVLVNGPLARELGMESGAQLVSRGANPVIGRAVGLMVRNIAGFKPGASYMGTFGYPLVPAFAEPEHDMPWEPFHVTQGFQREDSTVTIGVTNNWGASPAAYDTPEQSGAQTALQLMAREITHKTRLFNFPGSGPDAETVMLTLLMSPSVARSLAAAGYSKRDVIQQVFEKARMPLGEFDWVLKYTAIMRTTARERAEVGIFPMEFAGAPSDMVRVLSSPEVLSLVVCGDPNRNRVMVMEGGHTRPTTKRVQWPLSG